MHRSIALATKSAIPSITLIESAGGAPSLRKKLVETLREWRCRAHSRRELRMMSEAELKDLGYSVELQAEKFKPFWHD